MDKHCLKRTQSCLHGDMAINKRAVTKNNGLLVVPHCNAAKCPFHYRNSEGCCWERCDMLIISSYSGVTVPLNTAEHFQTLGMARSPRQWERPEQDLPAGFCVRVFVL